MGSTLGRLKLFFILIFLIAAGWLWFDQMYNVEPRQKCGESGGWWSPELRECKKPVSIRKYDGKSRPPPMDSLVPTLPPSANIPRPPTKAEEAAAATKR